MEQSDDLCIWNVGICAGCSKHYWLHIIDSVAAAHPLDPYLSTLKIDDRLVVVGIPDKPLSINALSHINGEPNRLNHNLALFCQSLTPHKFTGHGCFELHNAKWVCAQRNVMPCNRKELDPGNAAWRDVWGSGIGGIKETQDMLDFCGKHNITCMIEKIPMSYINTAM